MTKHIDYAYKSYVINEHKDLILQAKRCSQLDYANKLYLETGEISPVLKCNVKYMSTSDLMSYCVENNLINEFYEVQKINKASYSRTKRLKERISIMLLSGTCLFLTLTFNDDTLNNSSYKQRRDFVSRYLKTFKTKYIANIDFGAKKQREHYHAIILSDNIDFALWRKYGNINAQVIRSKNIDKDKTRLAKYIAKLTNHAIKETTKRCGLIYSR